MDLRAALLAVVGAATVVIFVGYWVASERKRKGTISESAWQWWRWAIAGLGLLYVVTSLYAYPHS
ncbi:MAG TPA: hypothetical protein VFA78_04130 [Chloroflexota bacterium]|nr:hypothetical protein [Chloroflexota bacterium]